ncbi:hypothetical protein Q7P37_010748 [Cladosporium fusiforme]
MPTCCVTIPRLIWWLTVVWPVYLRPLFYTSGLPFVSPSGSLSPTRSLAPSHVPTTQTFPKAQPYTIALLGRGIFTSAGLTDEPPILLPGMVIRRPTCPASTHEISLSNSPAAAARSNNRLHPLYPMSLQSSAHAGETSKIPNNPIPWPSFLHDAGLRRTLQSSALKHAAIHTYCSR